MLLTTTQVEVPAVKIPYLFNTVRIQCDLALGGSKTGEPGWRCASQLPQHVRAAQESQVHGGAEGANPCCPAPCSGFGRISCEQHGWRSGDESHLVAPILSNPPKMINLVHTAGFCVSHHVRLQWGDIYPPDDEGCSIIFNLSIEEGDSSRAYGIK